MNKNKAKEEEYDGDDETEQAIGDVFDLKESSIKIYSQDQFMNQDFTLSHLDDGFYKRKSTKFIREQLRLMESLGSFFKLDSDNKILKETEGYWFSKCVGVFGGDIRSLLILSRAKAGAPLKSYISYGHDTIASNEITKDNRSVLDRLFGRKKKAKEGDIQYE